MTKLLALCSVQLGDPTGTVDIVGYDDDGMPKTKARVIYVEPGEIFEAPDDQVDRLVQLDAATRDLDYRDARLFED